MLEIAFFQNWIRPCVRTTSIEAASIEVRLQIVGVGNYVQTATTSLGLQSDIIQLSGMSMGLDVDRRIGPLLLHSSPFKPERVTKLLRLTRLSVSKQPLCLHSHCPYFRFEGDVKYYPCTIHSSVSMCLFVVAMVSAYVFSSFTQ
ncbi:uncharacterized [Tachysurus ichikawai]